MMQAMQLEALSQAAQVLEKNALRILAARAEDGLICGQLYYSTATIAALETFVPACHSALEVLESEDSHPGDLLSQSLIAHADIEEPDQLRDILKNSHATLKSMLELRSSCVLTPQGIADTQTLLTTLILFAENQNGSSDSIPHDYFEDEI